MLALMACGWSNASAESPQTMRLDFFHSGNFETEMFSLDEVVIEALPWTGNMQQPVDKTLRGKCFDNDFVKAEYSSNAYAGSDGLRLEQCIC